MRESIEEQVREELEALMD